MSLAAGTQLGPYQILASIGTGGMGEVYRAHDSRLGRDVAIKVAGEAFSDRFEREARAVATLNHPNICTLHDVGPNYLVMELIEGPTLADRIGEGPIPLNEALALASQIAQALEAAHEHGIVHRDLKPGNIKIREDGTLKILDFGLAKRAAPVDDRQQRAGGSSDPADSPTTLHVGTHAGLILGTAAYMAPEQARGKAVDKRADVWAFGVVLWEMLTGRRLFPGDSTSDILASVLTHEPDFSGVPPRIRPLLRHCLEKDPKRRLRDIGDWTLLVEPQGDHGTRPSKTRSWLPWAISGALAVALAVTLVLYSGAAAPDRRALQFAIAPPANTKYEFSQSANAVSPDGRYLAGTISGDRTTPGGLWLRPLDTLAGRLLPGTESANYPAWSPDSKSIVFFSSSNSQLKRIDIGGGSPQVLCSLTGVVVGNAAWNRDGVIVFGSIDGLGAVPQTGGTPRWLTDSATRKEGIHAYPQFLPDGKHLLYLVQSNDAETQGAYVTSLDRPEERVRVLATRDKVLYVPPRSGSPGYLLFLRDQTLFAQRFDASALKLEGDPTALADGFSPASGARGGFWASETGLLVYWRSFLDQNRRLSWIDRAGGRTAASPDGMYQSFRLSPDGRSIAYDAGSGIEDLWRFDLDRQIKTKLTSDTGRDVVPAWSPDGAEIAFMSNRTGLFQLYQKDARDIGGDRLLTSGPFAKYLTDWSRDSRYVIYYEIAQDTREDLWTLPLSEGAKPILILNTPARERFGVLSSDSKWIAYSTDESGREEVQVRPFPTGPKWTVSTEGGTLPRWSRDGRTLFFLTLGRNVVMAVDVRASGTRLETGQPRVAFTLPSALPTLVSPYDVQGDGQRALVLEPTGESEGAIPMTIVLDWQAMLGK